MSGIKELEATFLLVESDFFKWPIGNSSKSRNRNKQEDKRPNENCDKIESLFINVLKIQNNIDSDSCNTYDRGKDEGNGRMRATGKFNFSFGYDDTLVYWQLARCSTATLRLM